LERGITTGPNTQVAKEEPIQNTKNWNKTVEDIKKNVFENVVSIYFARGF
jgi:hypothetical protein